jgi:hypothetical protein
MEFYIDEIKSKLFEFNKIKILLRDETICIFSNFFFIKIKIVGSSCVSFNRTWFLGILGKFIFKEKHKDYCNIFLILEKYFKENKIEVVDMKKN